MDQTTAKNELQQTIRSLISMLDEPDPLLYSKISETILNLRPEVMPALEESLDNVFDPLVTERLEEIIREIHSGNIVSDIRKWRRSEEHDLIQLLQILSKYHFRRLNMVDFNNQIAAMQRSIWLELNEHLTSLECIRLVNHFVFQTWGLKPSNTNMLDVNNFYLNKVLENKAAYPATLGAFFLGVCQRLTLPVYYVALPENFILAYKTNTGYQPRLTPGGILFYINPLLDGVIFNRVEIERFLKTHKMPEKPHYFEPADNLRVASLLLREMQKIYQGTGDQANIINISKLIRVVEE